MLVTWNGWLGWVVSNSWPCHQHPSMWVPKVLNNDIYSDMQFELDENQFITLSLVLGYNKSDASYGWNGLEHGAELYFSHITDEIMDTARSIPLTAGLQPVISLQNIQKTYLGSPYTACIGSFHITRSYMTKIIYHLWNLTSVRCIEQIYIWFWSE